MKFAISFSVDSCLLVFSDLGLIPDLVVGLFPLVRAHSVPDLFGGLKDLFPSACWGRDLFGICILSSSFHCGRIFYSSGLTHVSICWLVSSRLASSSLEDLEGLVRSSFLLFRKEYVSGWFHSMICPFCSFFPRKFLPVPSLCPLAGSFADYSEADFPPVFSEESLLLLAGITILW